MGIGGIVGIGGVSTRFSLGFIIIICVRACTPIAHLGLPHSFVFIHTVTAAETATEADATNTLDKVNGRGRCGVRAEIGQAEQNTKPRPPKPNFFVNSNKTCLFENVVVVEHACVVRIISTGVTSECAVEIGITFAPVPQRRVSHNTMPVSTVAIIGGWACLCRN